MRYSRALTVLVVVAGVTLATLVTRRATPHPVRAAATTTTPPGLKQALNQEVQQFLTTRPPSVRTPALPAIQPGGTTCFVASGSCSLTPCVIPVQSTPSLTHRSGRGCPLGDRVPLGLRVTGP